VYFFVTIRLIVRAACLVRGLHELGLLAGVLVRLTADGLRFRGVFAEGLIYHLRGFLTRTYVAARGLDASG
jgi:hypothetical protein